ncbi:MAG TPA: GTPase Era [Pseudonocardia sp.]|nr:GTPase Era [Pseudonocardia sp.]
MSERTNEPPASDDRSNEPSAPSGSGWAQSSGTGTPADHRSGFACFVGRPNAGKSTLTNALLGNKVAITSSRPQTTRHAIRGIMNRPGAQLVVVDTPGLHKPRTLLGSRLNDIVRETWAEVDVIGFCVPADAPVGRGDEFIIRELRSVARRTPVLGVVTKTDLAQPPVVAQRLSQMSELMDFADIVPCSAVDGFQVDTVADLLIDRLPPGPPLYPDGELTDEPETTLVAELIREAALEGIRDELPHSLAVLIEEMVPHPGRDDMLDVHALLFVERSSQKGIIIGKHGARLKEIGTAARTQIEALLGTKIFLELHVKVAKDWQRDPRQLRKLGF